MVTYDEIKAQAEKAAKHLRRLEEMAESANPDYSVADLADSLDALADQIEDEDNFLNQFREREFKVKVWMADEYETTVTASTEAQAIEMVTDNPGAYFFDSTQMVDRTDNVLAGFPYEPVAEEKI